MAKKKLNIFYQVILLMLALFLVFILLVPRKKSVEAFSAITGINSIDVYKGAENHASFVSIYNDKQRMGLIDDRDKLLHMRSCLQVPEHINIVQQFIDLTNNNNIRAARIGPLYTNNVQDVEAAVRDEVIRTVQELRQKTKNPSALLSGDIYVMILQAPYYKAPDGSMMSVQFNISDYGMLPINLASNAPLSETRATMLDYDAYIVFSKYKKNLDVRATPYQVDVEFARYRSKHEQCFIKCHGDPTYVCGCKTGDVPAQHYMSKCVTARQDASTITEQNRALPHNFPIVYIINRKYPNLIEYMAN